MSDKNVSISGKSAGTENSSGGIVFPKPVDHSAQANYGEQESGSGTGTRPRKLRNRPS